MNQGPIWGRLLKKTRGRQSRATVPLKLPVCITSANLPASVRDWQLDVCVEYSLCQHWLPSKGKEDW